MRQLHNGQIEDDLQIRFTAYLITAVRRRRKDYMTYGAKSGSQSREIPMEEIYAESPSLEEQLMKRLPWRDTIDDGALLYALEQLNERERYVFFNRVLNERSFDAIGAALGLGYKGVTAIYYRTIQKIKNKMKEVERK